MYKIVGWILRHLIRFVGRTIYRLRIRNSSNIPSEGGALLVANHASYMDFVLIAASVQRPVSFVMNADIFNKPGLNWLLKGLNCIPISPRGGKNNLEEFNNAVSRQINAGHLVVIFAEGTVTRTGQLLEFKKGVEHISSQIHAPVIPIHFQNVQGTPFTFRGGRKDIEKFSWKSLRREVFVTIGEPYPGKVSAFALRQKMKEMEVNNFELQLNKARTLDVILRDSISDNSLWGWRLTTGESDAATISKRLTQLDAVLKPLLQQDTGVAILLPKGNEVMALNAWLVMNRKVIVHINPDFSNEEQYYVMKRSRIRTLITTRDVQFTRYAPTADQVLYIEDMEGFRRDSATSNALSKQFASVSRSVKSFFTPAASLDDAVAIFFERGSQDEMRCVSLTHRNFMAVIQGLRQVYYFTKGSRMMSNLPLYNAYGFVLELLVPPICELKLEVVEETIDAAGFISRMMAAQPSIVIATPSQLTSIAELAQLKNIPFLSHLFTADLKPDHHSIEILTQRGIQVMVCAGMNETSSVFAMNLLNYQGKDIAGKMMEQENMDQDSIGKPLPGVALKICDEVGNEVLQDVYGQIWLKGASIASSTNNDSACGPVVTNGWFPTGLTGSLSSKGFIRLQQPAS